MTTITDIDFTQMDAVRYGFNFMLHLTVHKNITPELEAAVPETLARMPGYPSATVDIVTATFMDAGLAIRGWFEKVTRRRRLHDGDWVVLFHDVLVQLRDAVHAVLADRDLAEDLIPDPAHQYDERYWTTLTTLNETLDRMWPHLTGPEIRTVTLSVLARGRQ